jgi:Zn-dependent protease
MFCSPQPTPYDLNFSLGRTRVSVHVGFWFMSAIFGWGLMAHGIQYVLIWIACVFVSILLHEFGHVWAGQLFGSHGDILLYSFGGLAIGSNNLNQRWQRVIVSLSGPGIQLLLFAFIYLLEKYVIQDRMEDWPDLVQEGWHQLKFINLVWALFNLFPVWPLDGGMIMREFCEWAFPRDGTRISLRISIGAAAFLAINTILAMNKQQHVPYLHGGGLYSVLLFGMLGYESYQMLQAFRTPWRDDDAWRG